MTKFIVVTGGVISGVGKGVTTASIGKILKDYGYTVTAIKIDPYLNFDAGTLRPTEHGEVWVTDDGGEIDQDLGNYERFLSQSISRKNNITSGQVYKKVIDRERKGEYLGETVQFIPHIPDEIKRRIMSASKGFDFCLIEIGGTIGDYENVPFLFAVKGIERDLGEENVKYVLVSYLPIPSHMGEMKTKPTQQAIKMLQETGIMPDFIICRSKLPLDDVRKKKIETYANISRDHVISEPDIDTIYRIPLDLQKESFGEKIMTEFKCRPKASPDLSEWTKQVKTIVSPQKRVKIAMVGKYIDIGSFNLKDSYISVNESLVHAAAFLEAGVQIEWIDAKKLESTPAKEVLKSFNGIIVPGGFGSMGVEGKINAVRYARENNIPYLGLCLGLQMAVIEFSRNVCALKDAHTTEVKKTSSPVIDIIGSQKEILSKNDYGGTMRLGAYAASLDKKSFVYSLYDELKRVSQDAKTIKQIKKDKKELFRLGAMPLDDSIVLERHRHRYEVNPEFVSKIEEKGLVFSGYHLRSDDTKLMEFIELPNHKFFCATQAHPEFKSALGKPAPLFFGFIRACLE